MKKLIQISILSSLLVASTAALAAENAPAEVIHNPLSNPVAPEQIKAYCIAKYRKILF